MTSKYNIFLSFFFYYFDVLFSLDIILGVCTWMYHTARDPAWIQLTKPRRPPGHLFPLVLVPCSTPYTSTCHCSLVCVLMFSFLPFLPRSPTPGFVTNITLLILTLWLLGEVTIPNCPRKWWYEVTILREWGLENSDLDSGKQGRRTWSAGILNLWHMELCRWVRRRLRVREAEGREWMKGGFWIFF